jgi:hypothetical protein
MKLAKLIPFFLVPVVAMGCAAPGAEDESVDANEAEARASVGLNFTAAVGVVELGGKQICTAALVDVDATARLGSVSASGRQVVLGAACLGKLSSGYIGGAVFVTHVGHASVSTPIVAIDVSGAASVGFGIGILSDTVPNVQPLKPYLGASVGVHAGVGVATILKADKDGIQVGAAVELEAGVGFHLKTRCTEWRFRAELEVGVGAAVSVGAETGAAAIVKVGGELQFAASIDGQCIAKQIVRGLRLPLDAANAVLQGLGNIGAGEMIGNYELTDRVTTVRVYFYETASELRLNAVGRLAATTSNGATCDALFGACTLRQAGGYPAGSFIDVNIDTFGNGFGSKTRVFASVPR